MKRILCLLLVATPPFGSVLADAGMDELHKLMLQDNVLGEHNQ